MRRLAVKIENGGFRCGAKQLGRGLREKMESMTSERDGNYGNGVLELKLAIVANGLTRTPGVK